MKKSVSGGRNIYSLEKGTDKVSMTYLKPDIIGMADLPEEALKLARGEPKSLVDVRLGEGGRSGVDLVRELRAAGYAGYVCMLTGDEDAGTMLGALLAGADDYLLKRCCDVGRDVEAMLARRAAPAHGARLDPDHHERFLRSAGLTGEQIDALRVYVALGFPENKALAERLGVSERAASKLVRRAEEKLGVENRGQLVRLLTVLSGFGVRERSNGSDEEEERRAR